MRPVELAESLERGRPLTILDVRSEAEWPIEGPGARLVHVPAAQVLAEPSAVAARLEGPVAVVCQRGATAQTVAEALTAEGVDALVLEGGMRGWIATLRAFPVELGLEGVTVLQIQRPGRGCLSYLVAADGEAIVVDPAPDAGFYAALARRAESRIRTVFDTHIHADHLSGARELARLSGATLRLPHASLERGVAYREEVVPVADGEEIRLGPVAVRAVALPGHTTDMTGLVIADRALISGDSLFADGIARPDLQRGDREGARAMARLLHATLRERVLALGDDLVLLPGHTHPGAHGAAIAPRLGAVRATVPELAIDDPERFAAELTAEMPPRPANYESIIAANSGLHPPDPELESGGNSCATR